MLEAFFWRSRGDIHADQRHRARRDSQLQQASDYVAEVINAPVYDGVHYRTSGKAGAAMSRKFGQYTVGNYLKPPVQSAAR